MVFVDLEDVRTAADAVVEIGVESRHVHGSWERIKAGFGNVLRSVGDRRGPDAMAPPTRKFNPGFLTEDELVASYCVRTTEFELLLEALRECTGSSNQHQLVIGPRGSGKTSLLLRVAVEVGRDVPLAARFLPIVFAEESYEVATAGEFWLECLTNLAAQAPRGEDAPDLNRTVAELRTIRDDQALSDRCLGALLDFADREDKRLVLIVENLNMLFGDMADPDAGWRLRKVLQTEWRIIVFASATSRFDEIDNPDRALYDLFRVRTLRPLDTSQCAVLWETVSGRCPAPKAVRALEILTGGSPRLISIVASFGAGSSFRDLMAYLLDLVDDHTEYFKGHLESLPPQERRVYLALAALWKPATTREIADQARLGTSPCSAQLARLEGRGVVRVAGGTARRKQYYLTERLYNIYYLLRRRRGPDQFVEGLIHFMEACYSPGELKDISARMAHDTDGLDAEMRSLQRNTKAAETAARVLDGRHRGSPEQRFRGHVLRARAILAGGGDRAACEHDVEAVLALLPELGPISSKSVTTLMDFSVALGPPRMCELIQASPAPHLLLPLTTALQRELGREPRVAREVDEVAQDIQRELATLRAGRTGQVEKRED